jgi:putative FmdB family regulatory protein
VFPAELGSPATENCTSEILAAICRLVRRKGLWAMSARYDSREDSALRDEACGPTIGMRRSPAAKKGDSMPNYNFECPDCGKKFTITTTIAEHMKGKTKCPKCGHRKAKSVFAPSFVYTEKKS